MIQTKDDCLSALVISTSTSQDMLKLLLQLVLLDWLILSEFDEELRQLNQVYV